VNGDREAAGAVGVVDFWVEEASTLGGSPMLCDREAATLGESSNFGDGEASALGESSIFAIPGATTLGATQNLAIGKRRRLGVRRILRSGSDDGWRIAEFSDQEVTTLGGSQN
jgi:hypothetical protein